MRRRKRAAARPVRRASAWRVVRAPRDANRCPKVSPGKGVRSGTLEASPALATWRAPRNRPQAQKAPHLPREADPSFRVIRAGAPRPRRRRLKPRLLPRSPPSRAWADPRSDSRGHLRPGPVHRRHTSLRGRRRASRAAGSGPPPPYLPRQRPKRSAGLHRDMPGSGQSGLVRPLAPTARQPTWRCGRSTEARLA